MLLPRLISCLFCLLAVCAVPLRAAQTASAEAGGASERRWKPVAVAGFEADPGIDQRDVWLPTAVEETLAWRLRRVPGLTVIPTIRIHQSRRELAEKADDTPAPWSRVVSLTGAEYWLRGTCSGTPYAMTLELELLRAGGADVGFPTTRIGPARLFEVLDEATRWTLRELGVTRIEEKFEKLVLGPPAKSPSALEYYARGVRAAREEKLRDASHYAEQAAVNDPQYCPNLLLLAKIQLRASGQLWRQAELPLRQAKAIADEREDVLTAIEFEINEGLILILSRSFDVARQRFETAVELARQYADPYLELAAMTCLSDYWTSLPTDAGEGAADAENPGRRNLRRAIEWQTSIIDRLRELNDYVGLAPDYNKLALIYERLNELEPALQAHLQTIEAARAVGSTRTEATGLLFLGQCYRRQERWDDALAATQRCLELVPADARPKIRVTLGEIHRGMKNVRSALEQYEQTEKELADGDDLISQYHCLRAIAELRMEIGDHATALKKLSEAVDIAHVQNLPEKEALEKLLADWRKQKP